MKAGSDDDWQAFYSMYRKWLLAHAQADLHRPEDAEDVCQKVLIKVAKAMPGFDYDPKRGYFRAWLLKILKREVINFLRKARTFDPLPAYRRAPTSSSRRTPLIERIPNPPNSWPGEPGRQHLQELIDYTLEQLARKVTPKALEMFRRHQFIGDSPEELACRFGCTLNAVYTSNSKTLRHFRLLFRKNLEA